MSSHDSFSTLLESCEIAGLTLRNRIVMPPMATAMAVGSEQFRAWYEARARGGVGLIIMEALWARRLLDDAYCERLEPTVEAIRAQGVPVVLQLFQPPMTPDGERIAPSPTDGAREATEDELAAIPGVFAEAAARCRELGFAGVEPHGAHGFFLNQMFSPLHNRRQDRYGGSLEGRMKLGVDIVGAIRRAMGPGYPVFYRHTPQEEGGYTVEDSIPFLARLLEAGADVMDISPSTGVLVASDAAPEPQGASEPEHCNLAGTVRRVLGGPVIAVGGMEDPERAEQALRAGRCDLCAVGRQLIADADWPRKVAEGRLGEIIQCTQCDTRCFGNLRQGIPIGCAENPRSGNEYRLL